LANGEEIVTENFEKINKNVVKAEINVITLRNLIEQYQVLYRTIFNSNNVTNEKFKAIMDDDYSVKRFRAGLISNIRGAIILLEQNDIQPDIINQIKENVKNYVDNLYFDEGVKVDEMGMIEVQRMAENIIEKHYRDCMCREKDKNSI
jgi:hypothetical protein